MGRAERSGFGGSQSPAASVFGERDSLEGGEAGWKSWRDRVPQRGEGGAERGGQDIGKGLLRGLPGMGVAARLSAPRALVLWAALGAAGKARGLGRELLDGAVGVGCQGEGFRLLSPQLTLDLHLTLRTGGATRIISRETSCQVQPGRGPRSRGCRVPPSSDPGALSSQDPGVPAPSFPPPSFRSRAQPLNPSSSPWDIINAHFK